MLNNRLIQNNRVFSRKGERCKTNTIDKLLEAFNIKRSLNKKGCPYDNTVAEANFKVIKTELINNCFLRT